MRHSRCISSRSITPSRTMMAGLPEMSERALSDLKVMKEMSVCMMNSAAMGSNPCKSGVDTSPMGDAIRSAMMMVMANS